MTDRVSALCGGFHTAAMVSQLMSSLADEAWDVDHPRLARAVWALGYGLARLSDENASSYRSLLAIAPRAGKTNDVARALAASLDEKAVARVAVRHVRRRAHCSPRFCRIAKP